MHASQFRHLMTMIRAGLYLLVWTLVGCSAGATDFDADEPCMLRVWYRPERALLRADLQLTRAEAEQPELVGSWNGWQRPGRRDFQIRTAKDGEPFYTLTLPLPPGIYLYGFLVGDHLLLDDVAAQSAFAADVRRLDSGPYDAEYTQAEVKSCDAPVLSGVLAAAAPAGQVRYIADFCPFGQAADLDASSVRAMLWRGDVALPTPQIDIAPRPNDLRGQRITVSASQLPPGKYTLVLSARGLDAQAPWPWQVSVFVEPSSDSKKNSQLVPARPLDDAVIYQIIVDRFRGPKGALAPPPTLGRRAGGSLAGITQAVEANYFGRLGVTTLWLSPLYQNPAGFLTGRDGHAYEAYHGYWPSAPHGVEPLLGGDAELRRLVAAAHARGLRLIFDAVPNHVYIDHPYYREHSRQAAARLPSTDAAAQSWFHDDPAACVCGTSGPNFDCSWTSHIETCWFDSYLPDLNWRHPKVQQIGVDDLVSWLTRYDLDGMRIDAVPMMPRSASRRIVRAVHAARDQKGLDLLVVGEDYTGPGAAGRADIRSFLGRSFDGLDSAFDFPLMWAMRSALGREQIGLFELEAEIAASQAAFAGSLAVMAHMLGNHDTARFVSEATGDASNDPWRNPPSQPAESFVLPYRKQVLALTLLMTLPGIPVLYYGDEVALAGANDPDSRRTLPDVLAAFEKTGLNAAQAEVLAITMRLGQLRACSPVLRRGTRIPLASGPDYLVALHKDAGAASRDLQNSSAVVVISRARSAQSLRISGIPPGVYKDALLPSAPPLVVSGGDTLISTPPLRSSIYLLDGNPCLSIEP